MAIITPSSLVSEIRGSAGNLTYSKNRYRAYVKNRVAPTDTPSAYKTIARGYMTNAVAAWKAMSSTARIEWNTNAEEFNSKSRLGSNKPLNGYAYFVRFAILMQYAGLTIPTLPAGPVPLPVFLQLAFNTFSGNISFDLEPEFTNSRLVIHLYGSPPVDSTIESVNSTQLVWLKSESLSSGLNVADFTTEWEDRFGLTTDHLHKRVYAGIRIMDIESGSLSPMIIKNNFIDGELPPEPTWPTLDSFVGAADWDSGTMLPYIATLVQFTETDPALTFSIFASPPQASPTPTPPDIDFVQMVFDEPGTTTNTTFQFESFWEGAFGSLGDYVGQYVFFYIQFTDGTYFSPTTLSGPIQITSS